MKYAIINQRGDVNRISDTEPQAVNENTTVVEITDEDAALVQAGRETYPKIHYRWVSNSLLLLKDAIAQEQFLALPLEEARAQKMAMIKAARKIAEHEGVTVAPFGLLPTDAETQAKLTAVYVKALNDPTYTKNWKVGPTTWVDLNAPTIIAIGDAVEVHVQAQFDKEQVLTNQIVNATTVEEIEAINW